MHYYAWNIALVSISLISTIPSQIVASRAAPVEATSTSRPAFTITKERPLTDSLCVASPSTASLETEREVDETDSALSVTDSDDEVTSPEGAARKIPDPTKAPEWPNAPKPTGPRLYRFLLELLEQPDKYPCVKWINKEERMFKFYDSEYVARLWGRRKNRPSMKYENFARSLRCYKERGILNKPRQKLVYQFAKGW